MKRIRPPQFGQANASTENTRSSKSAQRQRGAPFGDQVCALRAAPRPARPCVGPCAPPSAAARNNRLPPRADLLRAVRERVQRVLWLVPEPRTRWDTGDSVLRLYAASCDAVLECLTLGALVTAVRRAI